MSIQLNHTIAWTSDKRVAAKFFTEIMGLPAPAKFGPFLVVEVGNGVSIDFMDYEGTIPPQHYAFLVSEEEFDTIFGRVRERGLSYWADPLKSKPGEINHWDGGRGVYFDSPDGHALEILTRPYGSGHPGSKES